MIPAAVKHMLLLCFPGMPKFGGCWWHCSLHRCFGNGPVANFVLQVQADAIMKRTQEHLRKLGNASVSGKPIVMRAE